MKGWLQGFNQESEAGGTPAPRIMAHWGFQPKGSGGKLCLSALLKYGLITQEGTSNGGLFRLSGAVSVLLNPNADAEQRRAKLRKAALRPAIHAELWNLSCGNLPDDKAIRRYLRQRISTRRQYPASLRCSENRWNLPAWPAKGGCTLAIDPTEASTVPTRTGAALANVHLEMRRDTFRLEEGEVVL